MLERYFNMRGAAVPRASGLELVLKGRGLLFAEPHDLY